MTAEKASTLAGEAVPVYWIHDGEVRSGTIVHMLGDLAVIDTIRPHGRRFFVRAKVLMEEDPAGPPSPTPAT